ncbi:mediates the degradation of SPE1 (ornithine decarboxylase) by the proteasome [Zygosaccharomyces mellis]|uniref:Mediates the degradation of SPE1 (Ornithine decarboxylase) by the proteasome n=1 Tax=Zygosaccharomyces mellis TaxID=42258 RepID=A0A4C2E8D0_9SACH|nr:mediates the degradation of SPE1 (ornithine decarboxylase) by the proteasome [Zygosaccharomyces mellis]
MIARRKYIHMAREETDFRIGMRDIGKPYGNLVQLYWDIILLTESKFLLPQYRHQQQYLKLFQKYVVDKMGVTLNRMVKPVKVPYSGPGNVNTPWRRLGVSYLMVYLPLHFKDVIWCKCDQFCFHVILPQNNASLPLRRGNSNDKEWLLALLELGDKLGMQSIRLYIGRDDFNGVSTFLRNLNWIGGKLVSNENRAGLMTQCSSVDDLIFGDENYVILEFEC